MKKFNYEKFFTRLSVIGLIMIIIIFIVSGC